MKSEEIKSITIEDNEPYLREISVDVDVKNDNNLNNDIDVLDQFCKKIM